VEVRDAAMDRGRGDLGLRSVAGCVEEWWADQQIHCAVFLDSHQSRAVWTRRRTDVKSIFASRSITCRDSTAPRPRLARRAH